MKPERVFDLAARIPWPVWLIGAGLAGAAWWLGRNPRDPADKRSQAARVVDAIYPPSKCAAAMNAGKVAGVAWDCRPGAFIDWLTSGRPKGCSVLEDQRISCPASQGETVSGGGGEFGGVGATGTW